MNSFSFFQKPVTNTVPGCEMTIEQVYDYIIGTSAKEATEKLRRLTDAKEHRDFKAKYFDMACFAGTFSKRKDDCLIEASGLVCIDFDHVGDSLAELKAKLIKDEYLQTELLFTSPSGNGLKWVVSIDLSLHTYAEWVNAIGQYIKKVYGVEIDTQCKDISRACFLPYDPECYINKMEDNFIESGMTLEEEVRTIAKEIAGRYINITDGYQNWLRLGFALADGLGESGRDIFHSLSQMDSSYYMEDCDKQYDACLKSNGSGITIKTFFQMAKEVGVNISYHSATNANVPADIHTQNSNKKSIFDVLDENVPTDILAHSTFSSQTFTDKLKMEDLPSFLLPILETQEDNVSRDKMLLGSLNIISGVLPRSIYSIYDRRKIYAPLYNIIYGHFGTRKGDLEVCKFLVAPVKNEMRRRYEAQLSKYQEEMAQWEAEGKGKSKAYRGQAPKEPVLCSPFVSANTTASAIYRGLEANDGMGIMFETEADTLTNMITKSDYGDYSDLLRKAHHHETVAMVRVSDKINIEIESPCLSVLLTCTGSQLPSLLPANNVANGLASRFLFYALPKAKVEFNNVFKSNDKPLEDTYKELGQQFLPLYHELTKREKNPIQFIMSDAQQKEFVKTFDEVLKEQFGMLGDGIQGFIFRLALECYRYAMVLTVLRKLSENNGKEEIFDKNARALNCDDRDFATAMTIANCLVNHTGRIFDVLCKTTDDPFAVTNKIPTKDLKDYFGKLPDGREFTTQEAVQIAASINIAERTAKRYLGKFTNVYQILCRIKQGIYAKKRKEAANG